MPKGRIETQRLGPTVHVLKLHGDHDASAAAQLEKMLIATFEESGGLVVVDLSDAGTLDHSIHTVLVDAHAEAVHYGDRLRVITPPGNTGARLFGVDRRRSVLDISRTVDAAVRWRYRWATHKNPPPST